MTTRPQYGDLKLRFQVCKYAKVHLASKLASYRKRHNEPFDLVRAKGPFDYLPFWIQGADKVTVAAGLNFRDEQNLGETLEIPLSLVARSKTLLALGSLRFSTILLADIEEKTIREIESNFPEDNLMFFKGRELVSCPIPSGFKRVVDNIAIRPHNDPDKLEIFDPAVGELELVIFDDASFGPPRFKTDRDHYDGYRAVIELQNGSLFLPYAF